ncbi:MAG: alpha-L-fucosidase [Firmicutes bacterium]|nr:alpha-L-fucosidase [Bacillota bacterium]
MADTKQAPFEATWESLRTFECPAWYRDAKFGIWAHWGPQSVPRYGDWYARNMYVEGSDQYRYHWRVYGHPSRVGYKDIIAQWRAEAFDPDALMELYVAAGARYFVAQAAHHDNFHNWNSRYHRWNAVNMGPKKDIVGLWRKAALERGLRFGVSEHLGAAFTWSRPNKGADRTGPYAGIPYDGNDPAFEDLYLPTQGEPCTDREVQPWYTSNLQWHAQWRLYLEDLIDQYQPDLLYTDGGVPFDAVGLQVIARLYNTSARIHGGINQAVYTQKDRDPAVSPVGVIDIERSQFSEVQDRPWQTDTCLGNWFYDVRVRYKTAKHVLEILVDVVSKNGNLLLNVPQRPDGTLDEECEAILREMAEWFAVNGEGIYGTRPWIVSGEGPSHVIIDHFREDPVAWTSKDFRFTQKKDVLYVFLMQWPDDGHAEVHSLGFQAGRVREVQVLGIPGSQRFLQQSHMLTVTLPPVPPTKYLQCLRVNLG